MRTTCQQVRFQDHIETFNYFHVGVKQVMFDDTVSIRETFHRDDLSRQEASIYWPTPIDVFHMNRNIQTSIQNGDPTLNRLRPENLINIRNTIQRSQRAVLKEQEKYWTHLEEQDCNHRRNSKIKGPCYICTYNSDRVALAYRLETMECKAAALSEGLILQRELSEQRAPLFEETSFPDLQGKGLVGVPSKRKLQLQPPSTKKSNTDIRDRQKFVAASA